MPPWLMLSINCSPAMFTALIDGARRDDFGLSGLWPRRAMGSIENQRASADGFGGGRVLRTKKVGLR